VQRDKGKGGEVSGNHRGAALELVQTEVREAFQRGIEYHSYSNCHPLGKKTWQVGTPDGRLIEKKEAKTGKAGRKEKTMQRE